MGVMAAIVPWNYPFHNVFNPLLANVFAGNALVIKMSGARGKRRRRTRVYTRLLRAPFAAARGLRLGFRPQYTAAAAAASRVAHPLFPPRS